MPPDAQGKGHGGGREVREGRADLAEQAGVEKSDQSNSLLVQRCWACGQAASASPTRQSHPAAAAAHLQGEGSNYPHTEPS